MNVPLTGRDAMTMLGVAPEVHPDRESIVREAAEWIAASDGFGGLVSAQRIDAWSFAELTCLMFPSVPKEFTLAAANLSNWISVVDDITERDPSHIIRLRAIVDRSQDLSFPLAQAWEQIESQIVAGADVNFRERVRSGLRQMIDAYDWEDRYRSKGTVPSLTDFMKYRYTSAGMAIYVTILERGVGGPFDDKLVQSPLFADLNQLVGHITSWGNDLLQVTWDKNIGNPMNLARVIAPTADAVDIPAAWQYYRDTWAKLNAIIDNVRTSEDTTPELLRYLDRFPALMTGVLTWMDITRRYVSEESN